MKRSHLELLQAVDKPMGSLDSYEPDLPFRAHDSQAHAQVHDTRTHDANVRPKTTPTPLHPETTPLLAMIEQATQPLELYGALWQWLQTIEPTLMKQAALSDSTEAWLISLQELLPQVQHFRMPLACRVQLIHMLSEAERHESLSLMHALLEHLASSLEPLLQSALIDPLQRQTWEPLLAQVGLTERPTRQLLLLRAQRRTITPARKTATSRRREALG